MVQSQAISWVLEANKVPHLYSTANDLKVQIVTAFFIGKITGDDVQQNTLVPTPLSQESFTDEIKHDEGRGTAPTQLWMKEMRNKQNSCRMDGTTAIANLVIFEMEDWWEFS